MKVIEKREWSSEVDCLGCTSKLELEFCDIFELDQEVPADLGDATFCWECCVCGTRNDIAIEKFPPLREVKTEAEWLAAKEAKAAPEPEPE